MPAPRILPPPPASAPQLRAKHLRRDDGKTERPRAFSDHGRSPYAAADAFSQAMVRWGKSNCELARYCGVDETLIRNWRAGRAVMTLSRMAAMLPPELVTEICRVMDERFGVPHAK